MENLLQRITIDTEICHGKPTVRGLRYPVEMILELLGAGMSHSEILEDSEDLENDDILAVLQYASKLSQVKSIYKVDAA
ncbi:MAG: Asr2172 protein [uncultured Sulfurovum sp.]|uniref:Asr2172 protein n=1 Tax=uncultured Sulfurovum sp. TaxID=269237 RepID=A0A6S6TB61_9BACT|nr:MAG: Asr2172 protein [uncultured Sulfurovum sp.]